ncbi:MAG: hypothetical protein H6737_05090 [Alphaproteobacteria bacterium]|nr:hypothetical protein [Alphaproteobacteria bacterium]
MITALMAAFAAAPLQVDLDGDGKPETVKYDAESQKVSIGKHTIDCDGDPCSLEAHDVSSSDKRREVAVCAHGPRDDKSCDLYTIVDGKLQKYTWSKEWPPPSVQTSGNNIVLVVDTYRQRLYQRTEKYKVDGFALTEVKQPIYTADKPRMLPVDRTFALLYAPDSKEVIANTRANSEIAVLGEHGQKDGWMLVRLSSGITGWVHVDALAAASTEYMQIMGAG